MISELNSSEDSKGDPAPPRGIVLPPQDSEYHITANDFINFQPIIQQASPIEQAWPGLPQGVAELGPATLPCSIKVTRRPYTDTVESDAMKRIQPL